MRSLVFGAMGIVTSFVLFWIMQSLISVPAKLDEAGKRLSIEFVRLRKDTAPEQKEREKPKRQKPEQQPPPPEMNVAQNIRLILLEQVTATNGCGHFVDRTE